MTYLALTKKPTIDTSVREIINTEHLRQMTRSSTACESHRMSVTVRGRIHFYTIEMASTFRDILITEKSVSRNFWSTRKTDDSIPVIVQKPCPAVYRSDWDASKHFPDLRSSFLLLEQLSVREMSLIAAASRRPTKAQSLISLRQNTKGTGDFDSLFGTFVQNETEVRAARPISRRALQLMFLSLFYSSIVFFLLVYVYRSFHFIEDFFLS